MRETTYLVSKHTKPDVKAQLVDLLLGVGGTLKVIIRFGSNMGGLSNNYLQDHYFCLGNQGHILLFTSQRLKEN